MLVSCRAALEKRHASVSTYKFGQEQNAEYDKFILAKAVSNQNKDNICFDITFENQGPKAIRVESIEKLKFPSSDSLTKGYNFIEDTLIINLKDFEKEKLKANIPMSHGNGYIQETYFIVSPGAAHHEKLCIVVQSISQPKFICVQYEKFTACGVVLY